MNYIAYYRVSTKRQGLGLEAQQTAVKNYLKEQDVLLGEYSEKESGKEDNRPELEKALKDCKAKGATLVIAKLDRLSRNVRFLFTLKEYNIPFTACDCPEFDSLTLAIFAGLAQRERELISSRTKSALAELKSKGVKLGAPNATFSQELRDKSLETRRENAKTNENNLRAYAYIESTLGLGLSLNYVASQLNKYKFPTAKGGTWSAVQVQRLIKLFSE